MRRGVVFTVIGLFLLAGLGVAVAQRGDAPESEIIAAPTDTSPSATSSIVVTTTLDSVADTSAQQTTTTTAPTVAGSLTRPSAPTAPGSPVTTAPTTTTRPADNARPTFPQLPQGSYFNPFKPFDPLEPAPLFPTQPAPAQPAPEPNQNSRIVQPRPGMENVDKIGWDRADVLDDRTVRLQYSSGVEPCSVLDRVEVEYRSGNIVLTLFEGSDPAQRGVACRAVAESKAVDVRLDQPINGRALTDGAG